MPPHFPLCIGIYYLFFAMQWWTFRKVCRYLQRAAPREWEAIGRPEGFSDPGTFGTRKVPFAGFYCFLLFQRIPGTDTDPVLKKLVRIARTAFWTGLAGETAVTAYLALN